MEAATFYPLKCGLWVLTWEWALAQDTTVYVLKYIAKLKDDDENKTCCTCSKY